jgi:glycosyltransferase involved in cell wall biosynthesis
VKLSISIAVVIPVYNRAKTIAYCLDSVCNQTIPPLEIIVVDDRSDDETVAIVNGYGRLHPSVRCVVLGKKSGAQAARNRGIMEARGGWIAFQDSDDEWVSDKLEKQIAALAKVDFDPLTVVHTDCFRYDQKTRAKHLWKLPPIMGKDAFPEVLKSAGPMFQGMLASKIALQKIGLLDEDVPSYHEWDTSIRLAKICRFIHLREPLFIYHFHEGETISKSAQKEVQGYQYVVDKHRNDILEFCGAETLNRHLENNALKAIRGKFYGEARQILAGMVGVTPHGKILNVMVKLKINPRWYDLAARILGRIRRLV